MEVITITWYGPYGYNNQYYAKAWQNLKINGTIINFKRLGRSNLTGTCVIINMRILEFILTVYEE